MKIFVTGATGLIGANSALELLEAGHDVRLLVRNKEVAKDFFKHYGYDLHDFVVADMLDKDAVKKGMEGCDAVLHSAAIVDLDSRNAEKTKQTNLQSIDSVIGSACELGIKKILYVSSMSVFYDFSLNHINETTPLAEVTGAYSLSKKLCEEKVREMQEQGHPIVTTYPVAVLGPNDPKLAESNSAVIAFLNKLVPITSSGYQFIDARDIAIIHRHLLENDLQEKPEMNRYIMGGHFLNWAEMEKVVSEANGKKILSFPVPGIILRSLGILFDFFRNFFPIRFPIAKESMCIVTQLPKANSDRVVEKTIIKYRPAVDTLRDTIQWLRDKGHI